MKKWMCCMTLVFAAALCLAGCSDADEVSQTPQPVQDAAAKDPLVVTWSDEPMMVRAVETDAVTLTDEDRMLAREGGMDFENWAGDMLTQIQTMSGENVITPQHLGHDLGEDCYGIDESGTCWVEWPSPPDAQDGNWYLYVQPEGEDPVLLDEGAYYYDRKSLRGNGVVMDYENGNVVWIKPNGDYFVRLYCAETGDTLELDQFANAGAQVAIGEKDAVWVKRDAAQQLCLMHCDLESGAVTQLAQTIL